MATLLALALFGADAINERFVMHPQEAWNAIEEQQRRARIENMPSIHFVCGRDWRSGPGCYEIGIMWGRDRDAPYGAEVYQRKLVLRWQFSMKLYARLRD